jgi:hypothetical protein
MAVVGMNDLTEGLSGKVGKIIFRTYLGKTYASSRPRKHKKQSEQQRSNREKFQLATQYAKRVMADADMKAYYKSIALQLALPNAYTAAITDYLRKPKISEVDTSGYNGRLGDSVKITASKKHFKLASVNVIIASEDNRVLEQGPAQWQGGDQWEFRGEALLLSPEDSYVIMVTATDQMGGKTQELVVRSV